MKNVIHIPCDCEQCEKNQEDAEEWQRYREILGSKRTIKLDLNIRRVQRLKQRIELAGQNHHSDGESSEGCFRCMLLSELEKILEDEK